MRLTLALPALLSALAASHAGAQAQRAAPQQISLTAASGLAARLDYSRDDAASACPDAAALQETVSTELQSRVFERQPLTHVVKLQVASAPPGLRASLVVETAFGVPLARRTLDDASTDCAQLAAALPSTIALALDPARTLAQPGGTPATSTAASTSTQVQPSPAPPNTTALRCPLPAPCPVCAPQHGLAPAAAAPLASTALPDSATSFRGYAAVVGASLGFGALPSTSGGGALDVGAYFGRASVHVGALLHPGARGGEVTLAGSTQREAVEGQLALGQLALCARTPVGSGLQLASCSVLSLGALLGRDTLTGTRESSFASALGLQARLEVDLTDALFVQARAEAHADLSRTQLHASGMRAWASPAAWSALGLALGLRL